MAQLNASQRAAVEHIYGPLLILAGAGSGKTRVITERIAHLLTKGFAPESILAVSFTNKAAAEMKERMVPLVGGGATQKLFLSTFHSFGVRFLQEENRKLGFDGRFVIFDQGDSVGLIRDLMKQANIDRNLDIPSIISRISLWKNAFLMPGEVPESTIEYDVVAKEVYARYEESLQSMHALDFDDLVLAPVKVLRDHASVREKWQNRFRFLMIDEFQDTNKSQLELIRLLTGHERNVCVVGDDDQSIYGWRGAEVGNILDFERFFPGTKIVKLEHNYRSRKPILDVANAAIARSTGKRHDKTLIAAKGDGPRVRMVALPDLAEEAKFLCREIRELSRGGEAAPNRRPVAFKNIAVLYRSNLQAKLLEEELRVAGLPYRIFGGTQFFDRKEVKDIIAYLRVIDNPRDELSLRRILDVPARGVGEATLGKVESLRTLQGLSLEAALRKASHETEIPERARRGLQGLFHAIDEARAGLRRKDSLVSLTDRLLDHSGLNAFFAEDQSKVGQKRRENVHFLMKSIRRFEENDRGVSLGQFLTRLMLRAENEEEQEKNQITLSSLHSAKGLEFDIVFFVGVVEGQLPHSRTTDPKITEAAPTDVEEERRLFYVGVTRAKEVLYITRPERKVVRGKVLPRIPSRFLDGLPEDALEMYVHSGEKPMESDELASFADDLLAKLRAMQ